MRPRRRKRLGPLRNASATGVPQNHPIREAPSVALLTKAPVWAAGVLAMAMMARLTAQPAAPAAVITDVADQPIIELPKFEVTDSRVLPAPEKWRYAAIPGFEVLSSISVRATTRFVKDFFCSRRPSTRSCPGFAGRTWRCRRV